MGTIVFDYSKLRGRIKEKYGSEKAFAEAMGLSQATLSLKLNGESATSCAQAMTWAQALQIGIDEMGVYFFNPKFKNAN